MDSLSKRNGSLHAVGMALALGLMAPGCDRGGVQVYQAPKEAVAQRAEGPKAAPTSTPQISWTLPSGWKELPVGDMRLGHFSVAGDADQKAQVTVIPLAGQAGGDVENVNRWRGQVGQSRLSEAEIDQAAQPVEIAGAAGRLFDFAGKTPDEDRPTRLLAAIQHRDGTAWFFKMIGDDALVAARKGEFVAFLKTVKFAAGPAPVAGAEGTTPGTASGELPPSHPPIGGNAPMPSAAAAAPSAGKPVWTVPAGWNEQAPGPMQNAKFTAGTDSGKVEITVSGLPGGAGGKVPNINRWRGQIGLPPAAEADLAKSLVPLEVPGAETYLVDLVAEQTQRRMIAAGVARGGRTWFYKMMGESAAVEREKEAFIQFVKTVKYGE